MSLSAPQLALIELLAEIAVAEAYGTSSTEPTPPHACPARETQPKVRNPRGPNPSGARCTPVLCPGAPTC